MGHSKKDDFIIQSVIRMVVLSKLLYLKNLGAEVSFDIPPTTYPNLTMLA